MSMELLARADGLRAARVPFVLATVVRADRPTSVRPGDRALVLADGTVEGFVGGACVATSLRVQSVALLGAGGSTLLRVTPEPGPGPAAPGTVVVDNPCQSGGTLEIFLEAVVPSTLVQVFGDTPIGRALVAVGSAAGYDARAVTDPAAPVPAGTAAVVVASHGHHEPAVLWAALAAEVPYVALVASPRRGAAVLAELAGPLPARQAGQPGQPDQPGQPAPPDRLAPGQLARVKTPAGLDLGARTPGEIAVSILAELITRRPAVVLPATPAAAVDPVCGMPVIVGPASLSQVHAGRTWHFCASGCQAAFAADPGRFGA